MHRRTQPTKDELEAIRRYEEGEPVRKICTESKMPHSRFYKALEMKGAKLRRGGWKQIRPILRVEQR